MKREFDSEQQFSMPEGAKPEGEKPVAKRSKISNEIKVEKEQSPLRLCPHVDCIRPTELVHHIGDPSVIRSNVVFILVYYTWRCNNDSNPYTSTSHKYLEDPHDRLHHIQVTYGTREDYFMLSMHAKTLDEFNIEYALWERTGPKLWQKIQSNV